MPIIAPKQRIEAPVTQRLKGGLFSRFAPIEDSSIRWENGVTWEDVERADIGTIGLAPSRACPRSWTSPRA